GRGCQTLNSTTLKREMTESGPTPWLVNSVRVKPLHGPEPLILGRMVPQTEGKDQTPARSASEAPPSHTPQPLDPATSTEALSRAQIMSQLLEVQKSVMLSYLNGTPAPVSLPAPPVPLAPAPVPVANGPAAGERRGSSLPSPTVPEVRIAT